MSEKIPSTTAAGTPSRMVLDRTYRASVDALWKLWTTKEGFESWWPPEGFRVVVHTVEARLDGTLRYDMIAETPELVATLTKMGLPLSHLEHARFSEFRPLERLVLSIQMDFLPGIEPYENSIMADFFPNGEGARMVVTLKPMHSEEFTKLCADTLVGQLANFEKQLPA